MAVLREYDLDDSTFRLFCVHILGLVLFVLFVGDASADVAQKMQATMYDDGLACPGNCDAHVVFAPRHNGTRNAFAPPLDNRNNPTKCSNGDDCIICFEEDESSCIVVRYRGNGPHQGRFDFTPAFFTENCNRSELPPQFDAKCKDLENRVRRLGYDERVNCFASKSVASCAAILESAIRRKAEDSPERTACIRNGQKAYNYLQTDQRKQRSHGCNYEKYGTGGPNSLGQTWRRLLPAACRENTFVGRDGLDCCSNDRFAAAALHPECSIFFFRQAH